MDSKTLINRRSRRTTLTLEADVTDYVERKLASDRKLKEKNVINDLLRKGIKADKTKVTRHFTICGFKTKLADGVSARQLEKLLDEI